MAVQFAHISDTHYNRSYSKSTMTKNFAATGSPTEKFIRAMQLVKAYQDKPDFVLITGDLVHEGTAEEYREYRTLYDTYLPGIPLVAVPGNHDSRQAFCEVMLEKPYTGQPLDYTCQQAGIKIIVLDSGTGSGKGKVSPAQMLWLEEALKEPGENGTILTIHQPFTTGFSWLDTEVPAGFGEILAGKADVILCGHTHIPDLSHFYGITQITAGGIGFGVDREDKTLLMSNQASFHICSMQEKKLNMKWVLAAPAPTIAETLNTDVLK